MRGPLKAYLYSAKRPIEVPYKPLTADELDIVSKRLAGASAILLRSGYVTAELNGKKLSDVLVIPNGSIYQGSYVYVLDENNSAKRVDIKSGYESRYYMLVVEGLEGGEKIIISGLSKLIICASPYPRCFPASSKISIQN